MAPHTVGNRAPYHRILTCSPPWGKCQGISHCLESGHPVNNIWPHITWGTGLHITEYWLVPHHEGNVREFHIVWRVVTLLITYGPTYRGEQGFISQNIDLLSINQFLLWTWNYIDMNYGPMSCPNDACSKAWPWRSLKIVSNIAVQQVTYLYLVTTFL